jgi:predicted RND superfamily exporter protein
LFLLGELSFGKRGTCTQRICASFVASLFIALVSTASLLAVVGYCALTKIKLSGFTAMSCVMSTGLAVEYSVHVVHRFLEAPSGKAAERVNHAMSWLLAPSGMAFLTSAFSVLMMAFSEFRFVRLYFFAPLAYAVVTSYFFGVFALPCLLSIMDCLPPLENSLDSQGEADVPQDSNKVEPTTPLSKVGEDVI